MFNVLDSVWTLSHRHSTAAVNFDKKKSSTQTLRCRKVVLVQFWLNTVRRLTTHGRVQFEFKLLRRKIIMSYAFLIVVSVAITVKLIFLSLSMYFTMKYNKETDLTQVSVV